MHFVWDPSFGNFRFEMFALGLALRNFRLETLSWERSFLGTFAWKLGLRLGILAFGSLAWHLWLGIFGFYLGLGELGSWGWGNPGNPAGGSGCNHRSLRCWKLWLLIKDRNSSSSDQKYHFRKPWLTNKSSGSLGFAIFLGCCRKKMAWAPVAPVGCNRATMKQIENYAKCDKHTIVGTW